MEHFKNKLAVITGAGSGIGRGLARHCAAQGMQLAVADLRGDRLQSLASSLRDGGATVMTAAVDVADEQAMAAWADDVCAELGVPDVLFNNAGILRAGQAWSHSAAEWQTILSVNVMGVVNGLNAFVPRMLERGEPGHIVNTGSVGSLVAAPGMAQYTAVKMAVRGITESLLYDLAALDSSIDVSLLCPGPVMTSIADAMLGIEGGSEEPAPEEHMMAGEPGFITADECAARVFEAIKARRFWIFTHPLGGHLTGATADVVAGRVPRYREVEFDSQS